MWNNSFFSIFVNKIFISLFTCLTLNPTFTSTHFLSIQLSSPRFPPDETITSSHFPSPSHTPHHHPQPHLHLLSFTISTSSQPYHRSHLQVTHVVLADYGVSRMISYTRGLAGTLVFMAPEILAYNGEQSYNDKVGVRCSL